MDPKSEVAVLTAGARIGQVVAHSLALHGCNLALIYRGSRDAAEASAQAATREGVRAITIRAGVTDEDQIVRAVQETHRELGDIHILLNRASIYLSNPEPNKADWSNIMSTNTRSAFLFSIHAAQAMKLGESGGRMVNFADWLPASGRPRYRGFVPYYTSKAAVVALTQSLAFELAPEVLVDVVAPEPILMPPGLSPAENDEVIDATPLRRWGGAVEIAKTVLFLVESDFVTSECIRVDGGRLFCIDGPAGFAVHTRS